MSGRKIQRAVRYICGRIGIGKGLGKGKERGLGVRLPSGGVQVCPARPSAHDFTVFRPLLINFRPSGICKVTKSGKHTQERCTEKILMKYLEIPFKER